LLQPEWVVELENDAEILEEIMDISPKTAKPVELSPVSKGIILIFMLHFLENILLLHWCCILFYFKFHSQ